MSNLCAELERLVGMHAADARAAQVSKDLKILAPNVFLGCFFLSFCFEYGAIVVFACFALFCLQPVLFRTKCIRKRMKTTRRKKRKKWK